MAIMLREHIQNCYFAVKAIQELWKTTNCQTSLNIHRLRTVFVYAMDNARGAHTLEYLEVLFARNAVLLAGSFTGALRRPTGSVISDKTIRGWKGQYKIAYVNCTIPVCGTEYLLADILRLI
jgi:hypothetical protein